MSNLILIASKEIGVKEIPGQEDNARILQYAQEAGFTWVDDDETPWCSIFASWAAMKAGLERSKKANARDWLNIGQPVTMFEAKRGDIAVFWRQSRESWQGHVAIFLGLDTTKQKVMMLGGNQRDQVSISSLPISRLLGFRRLRSIEPKVIEDIQFHGIQKIETYESAIKTFLGLKETAEFYQDADRFTKYPVKLFNKKGEFLEAYIQDVEQTISEYKEGEYFELDVILLTKNLNSILHIQTNCIGPKGCTKIEWDKVSCAWSLCN